MTDRRYTVPLWRSLFGILICAAVILLPMNAAKGGGDSVDGSGAPSLLTAVRIEGVADTAVRVELEAALVSRAGDAYNEGLVSRDTTEIGRLLAGLGWWNARVLAERVPEDGGGAALVFRVEAGLRTVIGSMEVVEAENEGGGQRNVVRVPVESGAPFLQDVFAAMVDSVVAEYADRGHPMVRAEPMLEAAGDTVRITLTVVPGPRATIDSVAVRGLKVTDESVVLRELETIIGSPPGDDTVAVVMDLLGRLTFVRLDGRPELTYNERGGGILVVTLTEGEQGSFDGAVGYQPSGDGGAGEVIGTVDLAFASLFGTGRAAAVRWENRGEGAEDLALSYREPWVLGHPVTVGGSFLHEERTFRGYTRTVITADIGRSFGAVRFSGGYRYEKSSADTLSSSAAAGIELAASWAGLDEPMNPRNGFRYGVSYVALDKRYQFGGDGARLERAEIDVDHYLPVRQREAVAVLLRYRRVDVPRARLEPADRYWLGGTGTVRGYPEALFPAVEAGFGSMEYRLLTGGLGRVFVFVDGAWLRDVRAENGSESIRTLIGYGFGLRIASDAGTLGFDFGLGRGDGLGDAKLHVRLKRGF
jgi:outer membrane protein assembly factor BamA